MATVNRHSLIQEFDTLKARFEALRALFAVLMEKTTPKGSANSSLPSSRTGDDETALARPGAKAKGPAHHAGHCANTRTREHVEVLTVERCARCGEDLADADCLGHERRTLIDIVFEKVVHHADAQVKHCPRCHTETRAPFPDSMPGPLQYGNGLNAYVVHLLVAQMLSLKRVAHSVHALIAHTLCEATLLHSVMPLHHALAHWERCAIERLLAMPALHVDETSLRGDRNNHWLHVYCGGALTVKRLHPKRGREAIEAIGILPRYGGVTVHDCWASSLSYAHCGHALCGAHLLRELTFIVDAHGYAWAKRMKRLLLDTCHQVASRDHKTLTPHEYKALHKRYRTLLTQGAKELPPIPPQARRPTRARRQIRRPQPPRTPAQARNRRAPVRRQSARPLHQQPRRAGLAHEQGQAEGVGVLPHPKVRRSVLPNLKLSAIHGQPGVQSTGGHSDRPRR